MPPLKPFVRNDWMEIRASGPEERKDEAACLLVASGCPGVLEEDGCAMAVVLAAHSLSVAEPVGAPRRSTASCTAYLAAKDLHALPALKESLKKIGWRMASSPYAEEDWSLKWRQGMRSMRVSCRGSSVVVKPTWGRAKISDGEAVVEIDPGMAFGTGAHPTTKLCLKAILRILKDDGAAPKGLLDVGTGSGVLAIASARLGVKKVVAVDIDPVAVRTARANARRNGAGISVSNTPVERLKGLYPVVVSNILAGELSRLSRHIAKRVAKDGRLILSGILKGEEDGVVRAYEPLGLRLLRTYTSGEWAAIVLVKAGRA